MENDRCRTIGDLAMNILPPEPQKATPMLKQTGRLNNSSTAVVRTAENTLTTTGPRSTGSEVLTPAAILRLAERGYLAVERALAASLPLRPITRDGLTLGWQVGWTLAPGAMAADLQRALAMLTAALAPCPPKTAAAELARVSVLTAFREMDSPELAMAEYGRRLADYPADIVADTLQAWPDSNTFFPKWNELRAELEWRIEKRRAMKAWIEDEIAGKHAPVQKQKPFKIRGDLARGF